MPLPDEFGGSWLAIGGRDTLFRPKGDRLFSEPLPDGRLRVAGRKELIFTPVASPFATLALVEEDGTVLHLIRTPDHMWVGWQEAQKQPPKRERSVIWTWDPEGAGWLFPRSR